MQSIWAKDYHQWYCPQVKQNLETPILIIGGGLAGLMCAYELMQDKKDFILVEARELIHGVTANTTAQISLAHDTLYEDIKKSHGEKTAQAYLINQINGLKRIKEIIAAEKIACHYHEESTILGANETKNIDVLNETLALIKPFGKIKKLTKTEGPLPFSTVLEFSEQAIIHPLKYLNGIIKILKRHKINLYENSQVTAIHKQDYGYSVIINEQYKIKTRMIIMACHYPFLLQNCYFAKMYQSTSYAIAFKTKVKIPANYVSLDKPYYYLRTYDRNTLIIGGSDHFTGTSINIKRCYDNLRGKIHTIDPHAVILSEWFTEDCMPLNYLPYVGPYSRYHQKIILVTGFQKWGFTNAHSAALQVCKMIGNTQYVQNNLALFKNIPGYLRMTAHSINGLIISKILLKSAKTIDLKIDEGKALRYQGMNVLVYLAKKNEYYIFKNKCTHMGCSLIWNNIDKVWISKCHGTVYNKYGQIIYGPGIKNLERLN